MGRCLIGTSEYAYTHWRGRFYPQALAARAWLPGQFHVDVARLRRFLAVLERRRSVPGVRAVLEVLHASWLVPEVFALLARANVALCLQDWPEAP